MSTIPPSSIFLEIAFQPVVQSYSDILIAELSEAGFDSFNEEEAVLFAYIRESDFNEHAIYQVLQKYPDLKDLFWSVTRMPEKNWNELWESSYEPVLVAGRCYIRAPFHPASGIQDQASRIEIVIEPKMSFGTAHHETTSLMIEALLDEDLTGKAVLDMGCGTGVLAILASRMGASRVVAIDNDPWAVENATENVLKNNTRTIDVIQGDTTVIPPEQFDVILANINRNTLIEQIQSYATVLRKGGSLFLSGFYTEDLPALEACASANGLGIIFSRSKNNWIVAKFNR
jgi:ribosomal protein L11 methyltransferase